MILRKTLMATTALMISFQPAMASMAAPQNQEVAINVAQGAEAAQILNDAIAQLNEATAALAAAKESGEGVEAAQAAFDAAQARVDQAQADFDAAKAAQTPVPEPEVEAPAPEAEAPPASQSQEPAAEEAAPEPEAAVEQETDAEVTVEEQAPAEEQAEEPAAEADAAQEPAPEAETQEQEQEAEVESEAEVEAEAEAEVETQEEAPAETEAETEEAAPSEPAMEEGEAEQQPAEEAPAEQTDEQPAATEQTQEAQPAAPSSEEPPASEEQSTSEEKPAAEQSTEAEASAEAEGKVEVKEPAAEAEPVEQIIQEAKEAPATVLPEDVSEQEKAALEQAEQQRRDDARKRRNELIGAAAVGVAVGALVPLLGGKLVEDQGDRVIIERNGEYFVRKDENALLRRDGVRVDYEELDNGLSRETMTRPNGVQIITTRAPNGDILRRERVRRDGSVVVLIDSLDRRNVEYVDYESELPPLNVTIDQGLYVVAAEDANRERLRETFFAPPVDEVRQRYTLREVRSSERLRDIVRRVDLDNIQFDTGSATVRQSQVPLLEKAALAIADVINEDPTAVFLIEGHTDAVGGEVYNLALSDRRAETVARILTTNYGLPPENFVVEGYGESDLKIDSQGDEPRNRRVAIRNITPLLTASK
ncbi:OmpA family protein [Ahrensia marina]|uniref:OmpA family protein n=1 Tax=Ahrensia marina TaxID=1514904 RepID=UPI0006B64405|nr:OmpA family protein [Ahrensia marina]